MMLYSCDCAVLLVGYVGNGSCFLYDHPPFNRQLSQEANIPETKSCTQGFQQEQRWARCRSCCPICPIALASIDLPESAGNPSDAAVGRCDFASLAREPPLKYS